MKTFFALALLTILALPLPARECTNVIDVIALGNVGAGITADGWSVTNVDNYSESYDSALRINTKDSLVVSPRFPHNVIRIEAEIVSSSQQSRRLAFTPVANGAPNEGLSRLADYSPSKNIFSAQAFTWPQEARVRQFRLALSGSGNTAWGVRAMLVITHIPPPGLVIRFR